MRIEETIASLEILNVTYEDIGFYTCKLINEIGMTMSRGKFDLATAATTITESEQKLKSKKKTVLKKSTAKKSNEQQKVHKTEITIVPEEDSEVETTVNLVKVQRPVSVLVEQSGVSELMEVEDRKIADAKLLATQKQSKTITTTTTTTRTTETIEITETVQTIRQKISQKIITIEDLLVIRQHEEVNELLETIDAASFGSTGEAALRDLASIGLLLRYGCTTHEIIYMYEQNIFISLQKAESQAALVQLVEREGHEELITQILGESTTEDETVLAATVGFKAFIRMIETCEITIETVITRFVREDFISQDWTISTKEVCYALHVF